MCRTLNFRIGGESIDLAPVKLERKKLYGWTEARVTTPEGVLCRQAGLDQSGQIIIPKGATKIGMLGEDGLWLEKADLVAVHADGSEAVATPSSFDHPIELTRKATVEELMNLRVSTVYQLTGEQGAALNSLLGGDIYTFDFSYKGGFERLTAFLLTNGTTPYIIAGEPMQFDFIGLEDEGVLTEVEDIDIEEDELDFSMM